MKYIFIIAMVFFSFFATAQQGTMPGLARIAGKGIMIFPGEQIPQANGNIRGFRIERKAGNEDFKEVALLDATTTLEQFKSRVSNVSKMLPYPIDLTGFKIDSIWKIGVAKGSLNDLGLAGISLPVIAGFNLVWLDENVTESVIYQYRVIPVGNSTTFLSEHITYTRNVPVDKLYFLEKEYYKEYISLRFHALINNLPAYADVYRNENKTGYQKINARVLMNLKGIDTVRYHVVDTTIRYGQVYEYYLKPYDALGNIGENSDTILLGSLSLPKLQLPEQIVTHSDTANTAISISWTLENPELLRSLRIYRSTNSRNGFIPIATLSPSQKNYFDQDVIPMIPYFYYFEATHKLDSTPKKSIVFSGTYEHNESPLAPIQVMALATNQGNVINWTYPYKQVSGFYVYRLNTTTQPVQVSSFIETNKEGSYSFTDNSSTISPNEFYSYTVKAVSLSNVLSNFSDTVIIKAQKGKRKETLSIPINVQAVINEKIITVFWEDLRADNRDIVGYFIYRTQNGITDTFRSAVNTFADKDIQIRKTYSYSVSAISSNGERGPISAKVEITTPDELVLAPTALRANAVKEGVLLQWEEPDEAANYHYNVYRYSRSTVPKLLATVKTGFQYTDKSAEKGELYFYKIRSVVATGKESDDSEVISVRNEF